MDKPNLANEPCGTESSIIWYSGAKGCCIGPWKGIK